MGFSVSSSTIIIFIAFLVSFGVFYGAWSSSQETMDRAKEETVENRVDKINTDIKIVEVTFNASGNDKIRINTSNNGSTVLNKNDVTVLIEGKHQDYDENVVNANSKYWYPDEYLLSVSPGPESGLPNSVKVITENGISDYWTK